MHPSTLAPQRPFQLRITPSLTNIPPFVHEIYSDSRGHGSQKSALHVRFPGASSNGGGAIAKSQDGTRCVVAGRESLRILHIYNPPAGSSSGDSKNLPGKSAYRIDASRNIWAGSGLKIDSATTDVIWGHGSFDHKILTSARNGELIMWDLHKSGSSKYERKARDHLRSIHSLACSPFVHHYCMTGSADGDVRFWDLRDLTKSIMRIHHPSSVRAVAFSPVQWKPLEAVIGLENGSMYRWDLSMGQRGQLDRIPVAHGGPILTLDWSLPPSASAMLSPSAITTFNANPRYSSTFSSGQGAWYGAGLLDEIMPGGGVHTAAKLDGGGAGWLVSGGLDRCVKVWDLSTPGQKTRMSHRPTYTLHTSFPVRRVLWRPGYECELAVVSNADFGPSTVSGSGSGSDLGVSLSNGETTITSPRLSVPSIMEEGTVTSALEEVREQSVSRRGGSDPIEIWDVRRGYVAKWIVGGSAVEGGVTDLVFGSEYAIWAQHTSGTFSQLDLANCSKPLDAIPHVATSWNATGSITFVTDRTRPWEIPYDDIDPKQKQAIVKDRGIKPKIMGDPAHIPSSQTLGTFCHDQAVQEHETIAKLAQGYIFEGGDKKAICIHNAQIALEAGRLDYSQTWLLIESLLTDLVVDTPPTPPLPLPTVNPTLPHSISAPAAIPTIHNSPKTQPNVIPHSKSVDTVSPSRRTDYSPHSRHSADGYTSPGRITPASSTASSPHHGSVVLPPILPLQYGRHGSSNPSPSTMRQRFPSTHRRASFTTSSIHSGHSESQSDSTKGHGSLRHVGEGALDDSDSSGSGSGEDKAAQRPQHGSDEEGEYDREEGSSIPPYLRNISNPSPLSQVAVQHSWTEDEKEDEDSPSPASTSDSESSNRNNSGTSHSKRSRRRRGAARSRTRSRSSTMASLIHPALTKQQSQSSIRTVMVGNTDDTDATDAATLRRDDTIRDLASVRAASIMTSPYQSHKRVRSEVPGELVRDATGHAETTSIMRQNARRHKDKHDTEEIRHAESRFHELGWEALRDAFESMADEGDVQMCALLSIIVPQELKLTKGRSIRFLHSYIDILCRLRLHTSAAYIRKYVTVDDIQAVTSMDTTFHTMCGNCRKPINPPFSTTATTSKLLSRYLCSSCKSYLAKCSICHLPVRGLLFQCPVCTHGGHQECYRAYYMRRPMIEHTAPSLADHIHATAATNAGGSHKPTQSRGRSASRSDSTMTTEAEADGDGGSSDEDGSVKDGEGSGSSHGERMPSRAASSYELLGHPCAAGCGHFCWAANAKFYHS